MIGIALAMWATAAPAAALTIDGLDRLPVAAAATAVLGPGPEPFVERTPWSPVQFRGVSASAAQIIVTFLTRSAPVGPGVCAVTLGMATFAVDPPPGASAAQAAVIASLPYEQRPLRPVGSGRWIRYYAADPPAPGAPDGCGTPVAGRRLIDGLTPEAAVWAVNELKAVVAAARAPGPLAIDLAIRCPDHTPACPDARTSLAGLGLQALWSAAATPCADIDHKATNCVRLWLDDPASGADRWDMTVAADADGRPLAVRLSDVSPPPA